MSCNKLIKLPLLRIRGAKVLKENWSIVKLGYNVNTFVNDSCFPDVLEMVQ